MPNLIAYIPVLNRRHYDWLKKYPESSLYLISQEEAEELVPRLVRMRTIGLSKQVISSMIENEQLVQRIIPRLGEIDSFVEEYILPDEDVCRQFVKIYIDPKKARFEKIWARWDMTAVKKQEPIQLGLQTTKKTFYETFVSKAHKMAEKSPDWWRQVGAVIFTSEEVIVPEILSSGFNEHFPTEYDQDALGDPRLNYEAGQKGEYLSLHAERSCIAQCARKGLSTLGASIFVTCFPCADCARSIVKAGIQKVFFEEGYSAMDAQEIFNTHGVSVIKVL